MSCRSVWHDLSNHDECYEKNLMVSNHVARCRTGDESIDRSLLCNADTESETYFEKEEEELQDVGAVEVVAPSF